MGQEMHRERFTYIHANGIQKSRGSTPRRGVSQDAFVTHFSINFLHFCRRMQFTQEDEDKLCEWIAIKIPYKEIGGRTGNRLYQQLCDLVSTPGSECGSFF